MKGEDNVVHLHYTTLDQLSLERGDEQMRGRVRKWKRSCCLLIVVGIVLALLLCVALLALARRARAQGAGETPLDVLLLIDHSDSMWEKGGVGSDPHLLRLEAAGLFVSYLGLDVCRADHRLGIIYFGTESRLVAPLTPLTDTARQTSSPR